MAWQLLPFSLGVWLMFAPAVIGYVGTAAATNDRIVGPTIALLSVVAMGDSVRNVRYWVIAFGLWLMVTAFVFGYPTWGAVSTAATGALAVALPFRARKQQKPYAGGWPVLWKRDPFKVTAPDADHDHPARPQGTAANND